MSYITVNGYNYHYVDEGSGNPVVMVHGNPTWSYFYRNLIAALAPGRWCIAPDHIGMGRSDKPQHARYTLANHIAALEMLLESRLPEPDAPGGRIDLVVHDWGGPIGFGYAVLHPERIRRIVVLNTSVFTAGDMPLCIKLCRIPWLGTLLMRGLNMFAGQAVRHCTVRPLPTEVRQGFLEPYGSWADRVGIDAFVKDIPLARTGDTFSLLEKLDDSVGQLFGATPMLIQWGMRDWCFTPFFLNIWRQRFPNAQVDEYADAGHYLLEDAGDRIIPRIVDFLGAPE